MFLREVRFAELLSGTSAGLLRLVLTRWWEVDFSSRESDAGCASDSKLHGAIIPDS